MEVRHKKTKELLGFTEEFKAGTSRTLESSPLQEGVDYEEYDLKVVIHPTRIKGEIYFGYAIMANDLEHAFKLPGFKPFNVGPERVVVDSSKRKRNRGDKNAKPASIIGMDDE